MQRNFLDKHMGVSLSGFTQLKKFINYNFIVKVSRVHHKLFNIRKNNLSMAITGFTLIEALVVIAIIALLSVYYVMNLRPDHLEALRMDAARLSADIRYIRNMAATRVAYNGSFPNGGYGILFQNGNGSNNKSYYRLYAGTESNVIKTVYLSNVAFRLVDTNSVLSRASAITDTAPKKFAFVSENNISVSGLALSPAGDYQVEIYYDFVENSSNYYYLAKFDLGRKTADDFIWSNLAVTYETDTPVCGNHVVETGEICEPVDLEGNFNSNCTPLCQLNVCGDGYILGTEQCEQNSSASGISCGLNYWCRICWTSSGNNVCTDFASDGTELPGSSCCGGFDTRLGGYKCMNCNLITNACPTVCPDPGDLEDLIP